MANGYLSIINHLVDLIRINTYNLAIMIKIKQ